VIEAHAVLIPARRASSRLPEKLLLAESGKPLLLHTCERAAKAFGAPAVVVCADDEELCAIARAAGFRAEMTRLDHQSGSDRIAEVAASLDVGICINVQADEPEIDPAHIRLVASLLSAHDWADMATLATPGDLATQTDPNAVKVCIGSGQRAISFTRAPSPWDRDAGGPAASCYRHIGLYAYRKPLLLRYRQLPESRLEQSEKLEQLRAIEAGVGIACAVVATAAPGIDVRADYDAFLHRFHTRGES
jgi:3-deoxy-manno-octulosonate cytidylyltransferase (CMP-KDO synthetase)